MPPLSRSSFKELILYELFEMILVDFPVWIQMSQTVGYISPSFLLWSLLILKVFLLSCFDDQAHLWTALISPCLSLDCLGCLLVCILMFAFFHVFCVEVIVNSFYLASGIVPLVCPPSSSGRQVIGRLAVTVAALPFRVAVIKGYKQIIMLKMLLHLVNVKGWHKK